MPQKPFETDQKLRYYLATDQLTQERMCRAVLANDRRFSNVCARHPFGGPDEGRDIEATFQGTQLAYGAVGFVAQASDSKEQKAAITRKFDDDLKSALSQEQKPSVFVFFTNIKLTISQKNTLITKAKKEGMSICEIWDRERLRGDLDGVSGLAARFQYLDILLSEAEQKSFFARWGDDIQSVISTGFQKIETTLNRVLFFQEASDFLQYLSFSFELDNTYRAEEIGHFRLFCNIEVVEPGCRIESLLFGSTDKSGRIARNAKQIDKRIGIKYGISHGQWETYQDDNNDAQDNNRQLLTSSGSSAGVDEIKCISISYERYFLFMTRYLPYRITLRDLNLANYAFFVNKSLADKIVSIRIYANGYKLGEFSKGDFSIDNTDIDDVAPEGRSFSDEFPVKFDEKELKDRWVRIRPGFGSVFEISFSSATPQRMSMPVEIGKAKPQSKIYNGLK